MTLLATSAFAPDFTHTTVAPDVVLTFASGVSPVNVTLTTGTYRMWLAPSAGCYLRALTAAVAAAVTVQRGVTYTGVASISAAGVFTLRLVSAGVLPSTVTFAAPMWRRLGMSAAAPTLASGGGICDVVGTLPVMGLALMSSTRHGPWQPRQAGGTEQTAGGRVYAIAASLTSYQRPHAVSLQPTTPTIRATQGADATALLPADAYLGALGSTSTAREWSVLDVLYAARNAACGIAIDNWQTVRTDTAVAFYYGYIAGDSLLSPVLAAPDESYDAWADWTLGVVLPTTGASITRA